MIKTSDNISVSKLKSGLTIITEQIPNSLTFSLGITAKVGTRHEYGYNNGIAHFMEHVAFRSSAKRSSKQIAMQFESVGAYTNAFTTHEYTCFYVRAMKPHFRKVFSLLSEIIIHPSFLESEIEKERKIIIEEIKSYLDDPEESIIDISDKLLFGDFLIGNSITGDVESVSKISRDELIDFHKNFYAPENLLITYVGNLTHEKIVAFSEKLFTMNFKNLMDKSSEVIKTNSGKTYVKDSNFQQSHILFSTAIRIQTENEFYHLLVLNMLFGDGMSSRLYQNIRERYGIAYSIYSSVSFYSDYAVFYIYAGIDSNSEKKATRLMLNEIGKIFSKGVNLSELIRAKEQLKTNIFMGAESLSNRMQSLVKSSIFEYETNNQSDKINQIDNISKSSINDFINKYFNPENFNKVILIAENDD